MCICKTLAARLDGFDSRSLQAIENITWHHHVSNDMPLVCTQHLVCTLSCCPTMHLLAWRYYPILPRPYTLFQNGHHFSILSFPCKLALLTSLSNVKFKRIFKLERGQKGQYLQPKKIILKWQPFWNKVYLIQQPLEGRDLVADLVPGGWMSLKMT